MIDKKKVIKIFGVSVGLKTVGNLWISWNKTSFKKVTIQKII